MDRHKGSRPVISNKGIGLSRTSSALTSSYRVNKPSKDDKKIDRGQTNISSFFTKKSSHRAAGIPASQPDSIKSPTRQVKYQRVNSWLKDNGTSSFGDESPESSFELQAPNNFRNPLLASSYSSLTSSTSSFSEVIDLTENTDSPSIPSTKSAAKSITYQTSNESPKPATKQTTFTASNNKASLNLMNLLNSFPSGVKPKVRMRNDLILKKSSYHESNIVLSKEQEMVVKYAVDDGHSIFYTGSAGTGKSVVLRELVRRFTEKYGVAKVGVTASTGLAACNIGGQTINRFGGIGLGLGSVDDIVRNIKKSRITSTRWKDTKVLIMDEISMIDGKLFTKLNEIAKKVRGNNLSFGGIQVILTGDFFQLPPVAKNGTAEFCFQSKCWNQVIKKTLLLTKVFRQKGDNTLIDMLNALRHGQLDSAIIQQFEKLSRPVHYEDGISPTELYPTREEVKRSNSQKLQMLPGKARIYEAIDTIPTNKYPNYHEVAKAQLDNLMCEKHLILKEDAQVMLLKNKDDLLVNGSVGKVLYFMTEAIWAEAQKLFRIEDLNEDELIREIRLITNCYGYTELPPDLASKLDEIPHSRRAKIKSLLSLIRVEPESLIVPVIAFSTPDGARLAIVVREEFSIDVDPKIKDSKLIRTQLPLLLSWALSIHKSQGQTLARVKVDLRRVFEKGQVYVALSRAVTKDHLQISNFNPDAVKVSEVVTQFYNQLEQIN